MLNEDLEELIKEKVTTHQEATRKSEINHHPTSFTYKEPAFSSNISHSNT